MRAGLLAATALALAPLPAHAQRAPIPEPNFAVNVLPRPCALEGSDKYERRMYQAEGWKRPDYERYPGACQRMRFTYGPIHVKPGQNDVLITPVTIEKPTQDGYITRFKPNLVLPDGSVPPVEKVHLHHAVWLSTPDYGNGPFAAAGEEKTIFSWPRGFGMPVKASDQWLMLYMVHSAVQQPMVAYIVYDVDFIPKVAGDRLGMKPAYPLWLDVRPSAYPVFNVQRDFGGADHVCTWPREKCAAHDPYGQQVVGQGKPGNRVGTDFRLPFRGQPFGRAGPFNGGTLIAIGGHLHPGGRSNDIDLVRPGRRRRRAVRIYTGEANYWNHQNHAKGGGPATSWDFSERVQGLPYWGVRVKPGDVLRSNATYDTTYGSTYEDMGIAVALLVPNKANGKPQAPGVDPYRARADHSFACRSRGLRARRPRLCTRGWPTHGHYAENGNYGGASGQWSAREGLPTNDVTVADFTYQPGDLSMISMTGVPTVKLGSDLTFRNLEGGLIYHTATSCAFPCLGPTGAAFPISDGRTSKGTPIDFDSSEMGVGVPALGAAKQALDYKLPVTRARGFQPGDIVTYYCRVHPSMRGAFEVTVR